MGPLDDEGNLVSAKKKPASGDKELKATVKKLRSRLERADAKAERWKKRATRSEKRAAGLETEVKKLGKRAERAPEPVGTEPVGTEPVGPDASWTVVQLRTEARSRGLAGLSGLSKAGLLTALASTPGGDGPGA